MAQVVREGPYGDALGGPMTPHHLESSAVINAFAEGVLAFVDDHARFAAAAARPVSSLGPTSALSKWMMDTAEDAAPISTLLENRAFRNYLERRVGDRALAEDILQDAFEKVVGRFR